MTLARVSRREDGGVKERLRIAEDEEVKELNRKMAPLIFSGWLQLLKEVVDLYQKSGYISDFEFCFLVPYVVILAVEQVLSHTKVERSNPKQSYREGEIKKLFETRLSICKKSTVTTITETGTTVVETEEYEEFWIMKRED